MSRADGAPPVPVMVMGYSRVMTARMIPSRQSADLLAGHWAPALRLARERAGAGLGQRVRVGSWRGGQPQLTEAVHAFCSLLGVRVIPVPPRDPEAEGLVERANKYLEISFLPGREVASPGNFNGQLRVWLARADTPPPPTGLQAG